MHTPRFAACSSSQSAARSLPSAAHYIPCARSSTAYPHYIMHLMRHSARRRPAELEGYRGHPLWQCGEPRLLRTPTRGKSGTKSTFPQRQQALIHRPYCNFCISTCCSRGGRKRWTTGRTHSESTTCGVDNPVKKLSAPGGRLESSPAPPNLSTAYPPCQKSNISVTG
jgi:hypothetical protein